jgi:hypothetical protein
VTLPPPSGWTPEPDIAQQKPLHDGATTNTWAIWVMVLLPLLSVVITLLEDPGAEFRRLIARSVQQIHDARSGVVTVPAPIDGYTALSLGASIVLIAIQVGLAVADQRALRRLGVIRPFSWGWVFLNPTYIIGRHVVAHRRVGGSLTPLWVWIGVEIVSLAVTTTVISLAVNSALRSVGLL